MNKIKNYCLKNGIEFFTNCGQGITIACPFNDSPKVLKFAARVAGIKLDPQDCWCSDAYQYKMIPVYEA